MLVLHRRENQRIRIGDDTYVTIIRAQNGACRIGIDAPKEVEIVRCELDEEQEQKGNHERKSKFNLGAGSRNNGEFGQDVQAT